MSLSQLQRPIAAAVTAGFTRSAAPITAARQLQDVFGRLRIGGSSRDTVAANAAVEGRRFAAVKAQGAYKLRDTKTIPKKLGAKKTGDSYVIPGNIIYKQRGTIWFPGENCGMGRDHTIFALATGYVKYYKDPAKHPDRQYIGVVFDKSDTLPYPPHAMRKRKLNLTASKIVPPAEQPEISSSGIPTSVTRTGTGRKPHPRDERIYKLTDNHYAYREENWRLGTLVRTEKRKMGSRRVAMKVRRAKTKAIQLEMRAEREDKMARRKEGMDRERAVRMARFREAKLRRAAESAAATSGGAKGGAVPPPAPKQPNPELRA
ncbi:ribosomal L27 protein-domain-containing protein [Microdochium trichocladiopsis]|uniref:Large ribosomal subunit protein bL27m n=1 Tax=Microdochium trichocladiopsis TaxID=1682393 RepID=A0A9P8YA85_9PEZI|nr:ribosomal L27 protein-domain-containing protein [Microdochium trichocladiopsis]KAH7033620.1 ribosomal L27 protein-domain-containing protein [Microdochium trichocladiopsis]